MAHNIAPLDAADILREINAESKFAKLAHSKDERIQLDTLKYLADRAYGRPPQSVDMKHHGSIGTSDINLSDLDSDTLAKLAAVAGSRPQ